MLLKLPNSIMVNWTAEPEMKRISGNLPAR